MTFERLIEQQRPHVERVIRDLARRHFLAQAENDDFRATVERSLERNDYELLRAFDGRSTWETYLTTVITREFFLFQGALWGNWRPTALAMRLGSAAMLMEELVLRNHFSLNDAIDWMRTAHRVDVPRHRLLEMAKQLGMSGPRKPQRPASHPSWSSKANPTDALRNALTVLSPDDRLILELRLRDRQPLTRIASMLKVDARPLQRRIDTAKDVIRQSLITQGIAADAVEAVLSAADEEITSPERQWWDLALARPSKDPDQS